MIDIAAEPHRAAPLSSLFRPLLTSRSPGQAPTDLQDASISGFGLVDKPFRYLRDNFKAGAAS